MSGKIIKLTGFVTLVCYIYRFFKWVSSTFIPKRKIQDYGKWAAVTGATDGIGKALAIQIAQRGINLVLISRTPEKLKETANEVSPSLSDSSSTFRSQIRKLLAKQNKKEIEIKEVAVDFSSEGDEIYKVIEDACKGIEVGILVNNVGVSYPYAERFDNVPIKLINDMIQVNVRSVLHMSSLFFASMVQQKKGIILNISSGASSLPSSPLYSAYAATKGVSMQLATSLQGEAASVRGGNILIQTQTPLLVTSKLSKVKNPSFFCPDADTFAKCSIRALECGDYESPIVCPYVPHQIQCFISSLFPITLWNTSRLKTGFAIREKALKKSTKAE